MPSYLQRLFGGVSSLNLWYCGHKETKCSFDLGQLSWYSSPELACQMCGPSFRAPHMESYPYALGST